ncbi:MAG: type IV secretory system conjugative DNA transfer family protein, partial [Actinomycetota bacterium]|nr:type IV secretory system conjugative DNA transfer family protein [Actinomycetota bacterium]
LLRDFVRQVVGRPDSSFDMGQVLDGGVCLVRVPKGILGEDTARLLGSFVVAKVWQTATHRARLGQAARVDASLVVDECQNFLHLPRSFDEMLAEARGYRLSMVLAHQHLGQLGKELRETVSANARTKVWFTMSPEDARALERHVAPNLTEHDLSHLGAYTAAARLVVDGEETPAFTLATRPAPPAVPGRADAVRAANRAAHARPTSVSGTRSPLEGRSLPAASAPSRSGFDRVPREGDKAMGEDRSGLRQGVHGGLRRGLRPGLEPPQRHETAGQGDEEGSVASADSGGRGW